jgi:hypothetical protein
MVQADSHNWFQVTGKGQPVRKTLTAGRPFEKYIWTGGTPRGSETLSFSVTVWSPQEKPSPERLPMVAAEFFENYSKNMQQMLKPTRYESTPISWNGWSGEILETTYGGQNVRELRTYTTEGIVMLQATYRGEQPSTDWEAFRASLKQLPAHPPAPGP